MARRKVPCPKCGRPFTLPGLSGHLRFAHGIESAEAREELREAGASGEEVFEDEHEKAFAFMDLLQEVKIRKGWLAERWQERAWDDEPEVKKEKGWFDWDDEEEEEEEEEDEVIAWLIETGDEDEDDDDGDEDEDDDGDEDEVGESFLGRESLYQAAAALKRLEDDLLSELDRINGVEEEAV